MDMIEKPSSAVEADAEARARLRLATLPGFTQELAGTARFTRLIGMTNRVYRVETGEERFCLRIPGSGVAAAIDRRAEEVNARAAAKAGVAPEVLYFGEDGVMLTPFIDDAVPLRPERLAESKGALERLARALRNLHDSKLPFAGIFRAFATIASYAAALPGLGRGLSADERHAIEAVQDIGRALAVQPAAQRPCHCDPTGRNILDTVDRVWLIDWEYSGMNDPMWDLAYFSIESLLDGPGDRRLLTAYLGRAPEAREAARMAVWKPVCEVQAALWALIQLAEGNPGGDFAGYAKATFERAAERMRDGRLASHLAALREG